jgi:ABC-type transport system involved in multi-copper enzyme maturation permease subunit
MSFLSILPLTHATVRESVRAKLLYGVVFFAVFLVVAGALFGSVAIGDHNQIIKDFGLFSISLMSVLYTILIGATLLHKELSRKTIYNIMSKPISRWHFVVAKFFGLIIVGEMLVLFTGAALSTYLYFLQGVVDFNLFYAYAFIMMELVLIAAFVIFFSCMVVTPLLNGLFALGIFIGGRSSEYLTQMSDISGSLLPDYIYYVTPHLDALWVGDDAVFGIVPTDDYILWSFLYVMAYSTILIVLAVFSFQRREFQ